MRFPLGRIVVEQVLDQLVELVEPWVAPRLGLDVGAGADEAGLVEGRAGAVAVALADEQFAGRVEATDRFWALRDVSFDVAEGEAIGVIGRNGSGKSTLLRAIAGLIPPEQGAVYITGGLDELPPYVPVQERMAQAQKGYV